MIRIMELRQQLEAAVNEIEEMKAGRERQAVLVRNSTIFRCIPKTSFARILQLWIIDFTCFKYTKPPSFSGV